MRKDEPIILRASGWHDYRWSLSNTNIGTLSPTTGDIAVYTSTTTNAAIQIVTVRSESGDAASAAAVITHTDEN